MEYYNFVKIVNSNDIKLFDFQLRYAYENYINLTKKYTNINLKKIKNNIILQNIINNLVIYNEANLKCYFDSI